jgi:hypothetical protein
MCYAGKDVLQLVVEHEQDAERQETHELGDLAVAIIRS